MPDRIIDLVHSGGTGLHLDDLLLALLAQQGGDLPPQHILHPRPDDAFTEGERQVAYCVHDATKDWANVGELKDNTVIVDGQLDIFQDQVVDVSTATDCVELDDDAQLGLGHVDPEGLLTLQRNILTLGSHNSNLETSESKPEMMQNQLVH